MRATKPVAKNAEKATTTNEEEEAAQEPPVSNTRVSHSRRKDQVVDDPQSVAKPEGQFAVVEPAVGRPQLAEYTSTQVQNPGSKKCCVLAILLSDFPQKRPPLGQQHNFPLILSPIYPTKTTIETTKCHNKCLNTNYFVCSKMTLNLSPSWYPQIRLLRISRKLS